MTDNTIARASKAIESLLKSQGYDIIDKDVNGFDFVAIEDNVLALINVRYVDDDLPEDRVINRQEFERRAIDYLVESDWTGSVRSDQIDMKVMKGNKRGFVRIRRDALCEGE